MTAEARIMPGEYVIGTNVGRTQRLEQLDLLNAVAENPQPVAQQYRDRIVSTDEGTHGKEVGCYEVLADALEAVA